MKAVLWDGFFIFLERFPEFPVFLLVMVMRMLKMADEKNFKKDERFVKW
jgi:hypothetical protein